MMPVKLAPVTRRSVDRCRPENPADTIHEAI
jgi:hypothetical protein